MADVTRQDITNGLRALGVAQGDVAIAHTSLSAFAHVRGGADAVIDALLDAVGENGTLVMPTFTWRRFHDKPVVTFDVANTPCETGLVPETFRRRPGVIRSRHVCHSVAALGTHAQEVMGDGVRPFAEGSSFEALLRLDAWTLLLGVSFGRCTAVHMVEEFVRVPYREYRDFRGSTVILPDGSRIASESVEFLRKGEYGCHTGKVGPVLSEAGVMRTAAVGGATITGVRFGDIFGVLAERLREDPYFLTTPG